MKKGTQYTLQCTESKECLLPLDLNTVVHPREVTERLRQVLDEKLPIYKVLF